MLSFAAYSQIAGLDPLVALGNGTSGAIQMAAVYDTLMRYDLESKTYKPQLAESLTGNADSTEWTLKLRANVKFTDGTAYDAMPFVSLFADRAGPANCLPRRLRRIHRLPAYLDCDHVYSALIPDVVVVDAHVKIR